jgi:hypothetical protein
VCLFETHCALSRYLIRLYDDTLVLFELQAGLKGLKLLSVQEEFPLEVPLRLSAEFPIRLFLLKGEIAES